MTRQVEYTDTLKKKLKRFRSDIPVIEGFQRKAKELETFPDPNQYGELKRGKWKKCRAEHITSSVSFVFRYFKDIDFIQFIDLDDHKTLFGRDNRS